MSLIISLSGALSCSYVLYFPLEANASCSHCLSLPCGCMAWLWSNYDWVISTSSAFIYFSKWVRRLANDVVGFLVSDKEKCPIRSFIINWCTTIPLLSSLISRVSMLKQAKYSLSVSRLPCLKFTNAVDVFLIAWLVVKCVLNASANCLKQVMDCGNSMVNHYNLAFFKVIENARHMMGPGAPNRRMDARNNSRWSCGSFVPSYNSMWVGDLKFGCNRVVIISWVNGWLSYEQEDESQDAWVGVMVVVGWKGSYCSWYRSRGIGRVTGNFHRGGIGGGGGGGMGKVVGMKASVCMVRLMWTDRLDENIGRGCVAVCCWAKPLGLVLGIEFLEGWGSWFDETRRNPFVVAPTFM